MVIFLSCFCDLVHESNLQLFSNTYTEGEGTVNSPVSLMLYAHRETVTLIGTLFGSGFGCPSRRVWTVTQSRILMSATGRHYSRCLGHVVNKTDP